MRRWASVLAVLLAVSAALRGQNITRVEPRAIAPGKTTNLRIIGTDLADATEVWTSCPDIQFTLDKVKSSDTELVCQANCSRDDASGVWPWQVISTRGASAFQLLMIDDLSSQQETGTNNTLVTAASLALGAAVDGSTDDLALDRYTFRARKGMDISIEAVAQRLGSRLDPVLRLLDAEGHELAYCDDDPRVGRDARIYFRAPKTGNYSIELRDINYAGGSGFFYRLRLGTFPLPTLPYPPSMERGTSGKVRVLSAGPAQGRSRNLTLCESEARRTLPVRESRNLGASVVTVLASKHPVRVEAEPNDSRTNATAVRPPVVIAGRFEEVDDTDLYVFEAAAEQRFVFRGATRSLGSPCDLRLEIQRSSGDIVYTHDPSGADEGVFTNTFKGQGSYHLKVAELNQFGGPDLAYQISIEELRPGFALTAETNIVLMRAGQTNELKIAVARHDFQGPIHLEFSGAANVTLLDDAIADKKNEAQLRLVADTGLTPGQRFECEIFGTADIDSRKERAQVTTTAALRNQFPALRIPPPELQGKLVIVITQ